MSEIFNNKERTNERSSTSGAAAPAAPLASTAATARSWVSASVGFWIAATLMAVLGTVALIGIPLLAFPTIIMGIWFIRRERLAR